VKRIGIDARLVGALDQILFCRICEIAFTARTKLAGVLSNNSIEDPDRLLAWVQCLHYCRFCS
jgi:hypothetical protein